MKIASEKFDRRAGLTLVELLVAAAVMGMISAAAASLAQTVLNAHVAGTGKAALLRDGLSIMDRITREIRVSTHVAIPNAHTPSRNILAVSGRTNDDYDFYFYDPLFPAIDEDPGSDLSTDSAPGLVGIDDDGDGSIDESSLLNTADDDEDGRSGEETYNGLDDDGDGNIDEDTSNDRSGDLYPGIRGMDDNGDGTIDNNGIIGIYDDDDDWSTDEDPFNYVLFRQTTAGTLVEELHKSGSPAILSSEVSSFEALWESPNQIRISLTLTNSRGESVTMSEVACARNVLQKTGKRVR